MKIPWHVRLLIIIKGSSKSAVVEFSAIDYLHLENHYLSIHIRMKITLGIGTALAAVGLGRTAQAASIIGAIHFTSCLQRRNSS